MQPRRGVPVVFVVLLAISVTGFVLLMLEQRLEHKAPQGVLAATSVRGVVSNSRKTSTKDFVYGPPTETPLPMGQLAPEFSLTGLEGKLHQLEDYRGHLVVLNFWATWCGPCRIEMPLLEQTYARLKLTGLVIIGVNMLEAKSTVQDYVQALNITFPILLASDDSVAKSYGVFGLPMTFFIDSNGILRDKYIGLLTEEILQHYLDDLTAFQQ